MLTDQAKTNIKLDTILQELIEIRVDLLINKKILLYLLNDPKLESELKNLKDKLRTEYLKENDKKSNFFDTL